MPAGRGGSKIQAARKTHICLFPPSISAPPPLVGGAASLEPPWEHVGHGSATPRYSAEGECPARQNRGREPRACTKREWLFPRWPSHTPSLHRLWGYIPFTTKEHWEENGKTHVIILKKKEDTTGRKTTDLKIQLSSHLSERETGGRKVALVFVTAKRGGPGVVA